MLSWVLIIIGLLALAIIFIKFKEISSKTKLTVILILVLVFAISAVYVYMKGGANLTTYDGLVQFGKTYVGWLGSLAGNAGKVTGYAVQQGWGVNSGG